MLILLLCDCSFKFQTNQFGGVHISTAKLLWEIIMWLMYCHHILAAAKIGSTDLNKTQLKDTAS